MIKTWRYLASWQIAQLRAFPEPPGTAPIGIWIAFRQSALSIKPLTTYSHNKWHRAAKIHRQNTTCIQRYMLPCISGIHGVLSKLLGTVIKLWNKLAKKHRLSAAVSYKKNSTNLKYKAVTRNNDDAIPFIKS